MTPVFYLNIGLVIALLVQMWAYLRIIRQWKDTCRRWKDVATEWRSRFEGCQRVSNNQQKIIRELQKRR